MELVTQILPTLEVLAASGSSDDDGSGLALVLLLAGPVFYAVVYFRYRNSHQRHRHEKETEASTHDMRADDQFVQSRKGLSSSTMSGANHKDVRGTIRKIF